VIEEEDVLRAAGVVGLRLDREKIPGVTAQLRRIADIAREVDSVELGAEDELAPEWRP